MLNFKFRDLVGDTVAGAIIATSNLALAVSFAAAIFQGELAAGFMTGVWIMLMTMIIVGLAIGMLTTLPPIAGGPDTAVIAVIGLMAPAIAGPMLAAGTPIADALVHVMLGITMVALASGVALLVLGITGWAQSLRFVPYPLVAGFLAATGIQLMSFSIKIVTGDTFSLGELSTLWSADHLPKIGMMLAFTFLLGGARRLSRSPLVTPLIFFGFALGLSAVLQNGQFGDPSTWYLWSGNEVTAWMPHQELRQPSIEWSAYVSALPEMATCVIVGIISLLVRISTFESNRMASADISHEFRIYGAGSLLSGLSGGMTGGILFSTSKFLAESSAKTHFVYIVIAALIALTIFADLDLAHLVPTPVLGGFLLLLGYSMTAEALKVAMQQRGATEMMLTGGIMTLCLWQGFIVGVVAGFIAACLHFAFSYARIGVVRRDTTRKLLGAATERAHHVEEVIRKNGESIHLYELEGYIFFGSSEAVFAKIKRRGHSQRETPIRSIILDLSRITGYDSSAVNTLNKLRGYCGLHQIQLVICGIDSHNFKKLFTTHASNGIANVQFFADPLDALDWAEAHLLSSLGQEPQIDAETTELGPWLSSEFGVAIGQDVIDTYFERTEAPAGTRLYAQGDPADTIDFVTAGTVAIMLELEGGQAQCLRRSARQTIVGEMGFFREAKRVASVYVETPTVIYTVRRAGFEAMKYEQPLVYSGLLTFVIRTLADRLDRSTAELSTMRHVEAGTNSDT